MIDPWASMMILRRCWRCDDWLPLSEFVELDKVCRECMLPQKPKLIGPAPRTRNLVITESGRALLRQMRAEEDAA